MSSSMQNQVIRNIAFYLVEQYMMDNNCSKEEALNTIIQTTVYEALMDPETELFLESRESVYDILKEEFAGNPQRLLML